MNIDLGIVKQSYISIKMALHNWMNR